MSMHDDDQRCHVTRRQLIQGAVGAAAAISGIPAWGEIPSDPARTTEHGDPLKEFAYGDVAFDPGPHQAQLEGTHSVLMGLDEDSLLRPFRLAAGLPAPGIDLNGWYSKPSYGASTFGQWVSAISRYHAIHRDEASRQKVQRLVQGFAETIGPTGKLYRAAENPIYVHDKLVLGITDAAAFCQSEASKVVLSVMMDAAQVVLEKKASKDLYKNIKEAKGGMGGENYNFAETLLMAWRESGDRRYYDLAKRDLDDGFIEPLAHGENELPVRHAYSHINGLCGAAKAYLVLGDSKYLKAAINGLAFAEQQSFATGAYGPWEAFLPKPAVHHPEVGFDWPAASTPGDCILNEVNHFETGCGSYGHFKLTRYLLRITKNAQYGDSMERIMYNAALGALPLNKFGFAFYQSNYHRRARKRYFDGYRHNMEAEWPCCSGTLPQLAADYRISAYFRDAMGVFVNLYIPSTLRWSQSGVDVSLTQAGDYPLSDRVTLTVDPSRSMPFTLRLRIPAWAQAAALWVNGSPVTGVQSGSFAEVHRHWRSGDRVELILPRPMQLIPADDQHQDLVAVRCGPLVLFAIGEELPKLNRRALLTAKQLADAAPEWRSGEVRFLPWWVIKDEVYTTYHDVGSKT